MVGLIKLNNIEGVGGSLPQGENIKIHGEIEGWDVIEIPDEKISEFREFNIIPVDQSIAEKIDSPDEVGAYNGSDIEEEYYGKEMVEASIVNEEDNVDLADDEGQMNFSEEDVRPYKEVEALIKNIDRKVNLNNKIRGSIKDIDDDIADSKVSIQTALYYLANDWKAKSQDKKDKNPQKEGIEKIATKLLSDSVKMRSDLKNGQEKITKIFEDEEKISKIIQK